ncbi:MAG: cytochrome-c peroxidase [Methylohalobius crimeensis]
MFDMKPLLTVVALASVTHSAGAIQWQSLPEEAPAPADNPTTPAKVELGKILYFDPRLSSTGTFSCNSCHNVMAGGDDNRPFAAGVHGQTGGRSAPTVWNAAFHATQFWDGRAASLEDQARGPVTNPVEMGMKSWDDVVSRLKQVPGYPDLFKEAFGADAEITEDNAVKAIAAYERTLITPNSPYDRYVEGDKSALSDQQVRGMQTFAEVGCVGCHSGPAFSGQMKQGAGVFQKFPVFDNPFFERKYNFKEDLGRYDVTKQEADKHLFKVPTLRNVALTAPYFHNGSVKTLDQAVRVMGKLQLNRDLTDEQVADIVAFLNGLTGEFPEQEMPRLPVTPGKTFDFIK